MARQHGRTFPAMNRVILFLLGAIFLLAPSPTLAEEAAPEAVKWATDYLKACQDKQFETAVGMSAKEVRLGVKPTDPTEVARKVADALKGETYELTFSHRASGGVHGSFFKTSKGDIIVSVYRDAGTWSVTSVKL